MGSILCVTRNDEGGIRAQDEAIQIAKDRGDSLVFLFVADNSFLNKLATPIVVDIKDFLEAWGGLFDFERLNVPQQRVSMQNH